MNRYAELEDAINHGGVMKSIRVKATVRNFHGQLQALSSRKRFMVEASALPNVMTIISSTEALKSDIPTHPPEHSATEEV